MRKLLYLSLGTLAAIGCLAMLMHRRVASFPRGVEPERPVAAPASAPVISDNTGQAPASTYPPPSPADFAQATTLDAVLAAHNDNDPRLDKDLRELSEPAKALFRQKFDSLPAEKRNEQGTVVFLLGRNIRGPDDLNFMEKVINSPPCRSLANCAADADRVAGAEMHAEAGMETTLAYPQIVALKSLEQVLNAGKGDPRYQKAWDILSAAAHSPVPKVAQVAQAILAQRRP